MVILGANSVYLEFGKRVEPFHNVDQTTTMYTLNVLQFFQLYLKQVQIKEKRLSLSYTLRKVYLLW